MGRFYANLDFVEPSTTFEVYACDMPKVGQVNSNALAASINILIIEVIVRGPA